ncbi:MAG: Eco57I restriction-modification methylase domain-containing protein [Deltaproteobacteria bacterium]|jgi:hypothetical protein|nr:Eco57I restriction-modification methylase domain-containing protein [Deltaproteobacteria bacterium]
MAGDAVSESRGAVFTRPEVAGFILDLVGYTADRPLHEMRLLEPSFGAGAFLLPAIGRLVRAWRRAGGGNPDATGLGEAIRAVELHADTFAGTRAEVLALLAREGFSAEVAGELADRWLSRGDFLLAELDGGFDFVAGNPPYVRQELIPAPLVREYRSRFRTMRGRADLYVPFIERSLSLLAEGGHLGFICSDRWTKNRYGGQLRRLVCDRFRLKAYVDMEGTSPFRSDVAAYPAIFVIVREEPGPTRVAGRPDLDRATLSELAALVRTEAPPDDRGPVRELAEVAAGSEPWLLETSGRPGLVRRLESLFIPLEGAGCRVGIGVATGADKAFIGDFESMDVEPDRKIRLAMTGDIVSGEVRWRGLGVVNPFAESGGLVDLAGYPRLGRYLEERRDVVAGRRCARKSPLSWYRTIDRIVPSLAATPKLLIPDIKSEANVVFEDGRLYPHHNLYYVTSDEWDLRCLQALLLSAVGRLFVEAYSTRMRGGFLRFQAQYLRRIRVPRWADVPAKSRIELAEAAARRDLPACDRAACGLYGISDGERAAVLGGGYPMPPVPSRIG